MIPQTDKCPFCSLELSSYFKDEFTTVWYCKDCYYPVDKSMPRYVVTSFSPQSAYMQELIIGNHHIKNDFHGKQTTISELKGYILVNSIKMPLADWDFDKPESFNEKLQTLLTFS